MQPRCSPARVSIAGSETPGRDHNQEAEKWGHAFVRRSLSSILAICDIPRRRQEGPPRAADL